MSPNNAHLIVTNDQKDVLDKTEVIVATAVMNGAVIERKEVNLVEAVVAVVVVVVQVIVILEEVVANILES